MLFNRSLPILNSFQKGTAASEGEVRTWSNGRKYKKVGGKWTLVSDGHNKKEDDPTSKRENKVSTDKSANKLRDIILHHLNKGIDTDTMYRKDGKLIKARQDLHDKIKSDHFKNIKPSKNKVFHMTGGAPANGKSAFLESEHSTIPKNNIVDINSDNIKEGLPEYNFLKDSDHRAAAFVHEESSGLSKDILSEATRNGYDVVLDGVGDGGVDKLKAKLQGYKEHGHKVVANYVTLDTDLSIKLAKMRAEKTGRHVPLDYVAAMNAEIPKILPQLLKEDLFHELNLWDTNEQGKPRKVLEHKDGKTTIVDQKLYDRFLAKADNKVAFT